MSWKGFAAGLGAGVALTVFAKNQLEKGESPLSAEKALKIVKKKAAQIGDVEGSWVHMMTEEYETDHLVYHVYRGGITIAEESGKIAAYEFLVDSSTGTVLEFTKQEDAA